MANLPIQVLLCEPTSELHESLKIRFGEALSAVGYRANMQACDSIDRALQLVKDSDIELLITDLSFNVAIATGLDFIKTVKSTYPEIGVVACSTSAPTADVLRFNQPSYDLFVPKHVILNSDGNEAKEIGEEIRSRGIAKLVGFNLIIDKGSGRSLEVSGIPITKRELRALLGQVLVDLSDTDQGFRPTEVVFAPVIGGYSGSLVGTLSLSGENSSIKFVRTVVKISLLQWAEDEAANFRKYVKWMLPFNRRVELAGCGRTARFGAVAYAFVFGGEEEFFNLTKLLLKKDDIRALEYISVIFDPDSVSFYNSTTTRSTIDVGQHYRARYFPDARMRDSTEAFRNCLIRHFGGREVPSGWQIADKTYPEPFRVILSGPSRKFSLSVCHGDLNSDNVICASSRRVAYIDFQDTGPGHLLQDFAALENSIRLNWAGNEPMGTIRPTTLLKREFAIATGTVRGTPTKGYERLCSDLRKLQSETFPEVEPWEYPYAIGALSLKLMRLKGLTDVQLCRLAAAALVAAAQLKGV